MKRIVKSPVDFYAYKLDYTAFTPEEMGEFGRRIDDVGKDASILEGEIVKSIAEYSPRGYSSSRVKAAIVNELLRYISGGIGMYERNNGEDRHTMRLKSRLGSLDRKLEDAVEEFASNNMNLVVNYSIRFAFLYNFDREDLEDLFNESMNRAINFFDFASGNKFLSFAIPVMMRDFKKYRAKEFRRKDHFRQAAEGNGIAEINPDTRITPDKDYLLREEGNERLRADLEKALKMLKPKEELIIRHRFFMDETLTLKEVGHLMDITKQRVKQVQIEALAKLRTALEEQDMNYIAEALG
ncbi:hypothetical protein AUJ84_03955 [Candidatus Pacearchaeota archaeon CG1_02_32_132]|nr:MAG: hypothetical protein AUJ84_03955 [Candidatus Pacearchaeota archaeon CG1_02_32_132]